MTRRTTHRVRAWIPVVLVWAGALAVLELASGALLPFLDEDPLDRVIRTERLAQPKRPGELRLFLFGASTMNGYPFSEYASPPIWLRTLLPDLCGESSGTSAWRIINLARNGRGTDEIVRRMERALSYQPDAFLVYAAHNEGLSINTRKREPVYALKELLRRSRFLRLAEALIERGRDGLRSLRKAIRARMGRGQINLVKQPREHDLVIPGSEKARAIEANCRRNLRRMCELGRAHGIPVVLATFVSNEAEFPPALSRHREGLTADALHAWERHTTAAQAFLARERWAEALPELLAAYRIDPQYAETAYLLGTCRVRLGQYEAAQDDFAEAIELDALPNRDSPRLNDDLIAIAREFGMPVADFRSRIERLAPHGLIGGEHVVDNCHLDPYGQSLLARSFLEALAPVEPFASRCAWRWDRLQPFESYVRAFRITDAQWAETYQALGVYLGSHTDQAIAAFRAALDYAPRDPQIAKLLALAYYRGGRRDECVQLLRGMEQEHRVVFTALLREFPELASLAGRRASSSDGVE